MQRCRTTTRYVVRPPVGLLTSLLLAVSTPASATIESDNLLRCLTPQLSTTASIVECKAITADDTVSNTVRMQAAMASAQLLYRSGKSEEALEQAELAHSLMPTSALASVRLASMLPFSAADRATALYRNALEIARDDERPTITAALSAHLAHVVDVAYQTKNLMPAVAAAEQLQTLSADTIAIHRVWTVVGRLQASSGDAAAANESWKRALQADGKAPYAYLARAVFLSDSGKLQEALPDYEAAYRYKSAVPGFEMPLDRYSTILRVEGLRRLRDDDLFEAVRLFRDASDISEFEGVEPASVYFSNKVERMLQSGELSEAESTSKRARSFFSELGRPLYAADFDLRLASIYRRMGNNDLAKATAEKVVSSISGTDFKAGRDQHNLYPTLLNRVAAVLYSLGEPEKALTTVEAGVSGKMAARGNGKIYEEAADVIAVALNAGVAIESHRSRAIEFINLALNSGANDAMRRRLLSKRAELEIGAKQLDAAVATLDAVLDLDPADSSSWGKKGRLQMALGQTEQARTSFTSALSTSTTAQTRSSALYDEASLSISLSQNDVAMTQLENAVAINPSYFPAWKAIGNLAYAKGAEALALNAYGNVLAQTPGDTEARLSRGRLLQISNKHSEAIADFSLILATGSNADPSRAAEAHFLRAISYFAEGQTEAAQSDIVFLPKSEDTPLITLWRGRISARLGRVDEAMSFLEDSLPRMSGAVLKAFQTNLASKGYNIGTPDGVWGARTRDALKACVSRACL